MVNGGLVALLNYIGFGLKFKATIREFERYTLITADGLGFDIHYYIDVSQGTVRGMANKTIHITEAQLQRHAKKIYNRLNVQAGKATKVYARHTVVARVDKKVTLDFLSEHHLQIAMPGKYRYGLFHAGELISIAVFSGGRKMYDKAEDYRSFELIRFCHKSDIVVIGGLSKLLQAFTKDFNPGDIMTYVDTDWTQNSSLLKIGFQAEKTIPAQRFWIADNKQITILNDQELATAKQFYPDGYLHYNSGSTKLVLSL